ncbi:transglutaminase family protein [Bremerella sp. JC770]|uniref:transglutaminase family protein n=1 Tax=Bremerella sp. JC770 TaxID=3232137 RepID=UPI00345A70EE
MDAQALKHGLSLAKRNLSCAVELPGAEMLDIDECLEELAEWAHQVEKFTLRMMPRFQSSPEQFEETEARFRMLCLTTYLQRDLGIGYDQTWKEIPLEDDALFDDSQRLFLHGVIYERRGTCNSLPVLFTVVGRCLGYPLYLVKSIGHTFVRWEDCSDRFNIETTSPGFRALDDRHYHRWPKAMTHQDTQATYLLRNMNEEQENAAFFALRGHCLTDNRRFTDSLASYQAAQRTDPDDPNYRGHSAVATLMASIESRAMFHEIDGAGNLLNVVYRRQGGNTKRPAAWWEKRSFPQARKQYEFIMKSWADRDTDAALEDF